MTVPKDGKKKTDKELHDLLTSEQYHITREKGTERPFSGKYHDCKVNGVYICVCCGAELFMSEHKFDSGTGWPSFTQPKSNIVVRKEEDMSLGMARTEALCANCDSHLGHIFNDGPYPSGMRYCINSASLDLKPD